MPRRQRRVVGLAAADFNLKWMAGLMRHEVAHHLRIEKTLVLFQSMRDLNEAAGRAVEHDDQFMSRVTWYADNGLDTGQPQDQ